MMPFTASWLMPKITRGKRPSARIRNNSGVHDSHSIAKTSPEPVLPPSLRQRAHVHALEHPQEVPGREDRPDPAGDHQAPEQRDLVREQLRVGLERREQRHHLAPEPGEAGSPSEAIATNANTPASLGICCDIPPPISAICRVWYRS